MGGHPPVTSVTFPNERALEGRLAWSAKPGSFLITWPHGTLEISSCSHSVGRLRAWRVDPSLDRALMMDPGFQTRAGFSPQGPQLTHSQQ